MCWFTQFSLMLQRRELKLFWKHSNSTTQAIIDTGQEVMLLTTDGSFRKTKVTAQRNVCYLQSTNKNRWKTCRTRARRGGGDQSNESSLKTKECNANRGVRATSVKANSAILPSALVVLLPPGSKTSREADDQASLRWRRGGRERHARQNDISVQIRNYENRRFQEAAKELGRKWRR